MTQENAFLQYLNSYKKHCPEILEEELDFIKEGLTFNRMKKKEFFLEQEKVQPQMGFVVKGLMRSYYVDDKGKKITIGFIAEGMYASDYPSFIRQLPSKYFIEALEDVEIVCLPFQKIQDAYDSYEVFQKYGRKIAEEILIHKQLRLESFLFENGEQRYREFIAQNKSILNRISVSHLSSLLGIERQTLTRIRSRILEE